jgi:hypothetical protein
MTSLKNSLAVELVDNAAIAVLARRLTVFACGLFVFSALFSIFSLHCLYADGSYQLIEVLKAKDFVAVAKNRECASFVIQFFVVMAIRLGVTNLHTLQILFGLGCFLPWPTSLVLCRGLAPRHFWLAMLGCAVGYLNAAFMPVGEYSIAHAFFWPVLFAVLFVRPLTPFAAVVLVFSSLILVCSYESMLFLGPPLVVLAMWRAAGGGEKIWARGCLCLAAVLLGVAVVIALDGIRHPQAPDNLGGFKQGLETMFLFPGWTIGWSFAWLFLLAATCIDATGFSRRFFKLELMLLAAAMLVWGLWPVLAPETLNTQLQYDYRAMQLLTPFALLLVGCAINICTKWFAARQNYFVAWSASMLLAQSLWQISATWQWGGFVSAWRGVLTMHSGPVRLQDTPFGGHPVGRQAMNFDWNWANPDLSIMLAPAGHVKSIILSPGTPSWQPFDPLNRKDLPKLQRYGVNYDEYLAALKDPGNVTK